MLPGLSGFDVLRDLRQQGVETPVIMLTARGQVIDKVLGLKLGADDYLTKPFEMMELLARIEARLRRDAPKDTVDAEAYRFGAIQVDFRKAEVTKDGAAGRAVGARVPAAALLHRAPRRDDLTRRAAQPRVGLSRHAEHAHGGRPRRVAAAEDRAQPEASAVRHHRARAWATSSRGRPANS